MDSANLNLTDFFIKGFVTGKFFKDLSHFKDYEFVYCEDTALGNGERVVDIRCSEFLDELHHLIAENYISKIFTKYQLMSNGMWEGVDNGSSVWHNDQTDQNMNSNFLIYLDDTGTHDNSIEFKNDNLEYKVLPKENDFVWINQSKKFLHRATHNQGRRRVLSFEFLIDGLE